jgi:hypothetical protein
MEYDDKEELKTKFKVLMPVFKSSGGSLICQGEWGRHFNFFGSHLTCNLHPAAKGMRLE